MTPVRGGRLIALTAHARDVGATEREGMSCDLSAVLPAGSIVLVTCHRVEAYAFGNEPSPAELRDILPGGGRILLDDDAMRHLLEVAIGRDSAVLGEDEILHQIREALEATRRAGGLDPTIDRLFTVALQAGRRARSWQQGRRRSLGDVAVEVIRRSRGGIQGRRVLVVGAGKMGGLAARAAVRAGASVSVANRSPERGRALAESIGAATADLDPGPGLAGADAVIVALSAPWPIGPATASALAARAAVVVDLSYPSAVPVDIAAQLGERLIGADRLAIEETDADQPRAAARARLDDLVGRSAEAFREWLERADSRAAADALLQRADRERRIELDVLWSRVPALDPETRDAIDQMTRHFAERLLAEPLQRLGRDENGRDGTIVRDLFAL